jgi:3-hydroxybutyryl-CoA dehydratase
MSGALNWKCGDALPSVVKAVTQKQVNAYADAAQDWNPIHLDAEFAARTQFGQRIAHGMLGLGFVSEMLSKAFPEAWGRDSGLKVRFKAPVYPGDTVTASGVVTSVSDEDGRSRIECAVQCTGPDGGEAIAGTATVLL